MKVLPWLSVVLFCGGLMAAVVEKEEKKKAEEDIYGELPENDGDLQKDQVDYDYGIGKDDEITAQEPIANIPVDAKILSKAQTLHQKLGTSVVLPCQSSDKDVVRFWTKDSAYIIQGSLILNNKYNYQIFSNNGSLRVVLADESDFGKYECKLAVSDTDQPSITHEVLQILAPTITDISADKPDRLYNLGESVTLTCHATGKPKPKITWHKNNELLGPQGQSLTIQNIKAKHSGSYRCLADNSIDRPAHQNIEIFVNHAPLVSAEKYIVNSDHEQSAELVCEVKAFPAPNVQWLKNGQHIVPMYPKVELKFERDNERNIMILRNLTKEDFTQYSCVASNVFGKQVRNITLVKTPALRGFENKQDKENAVLQWKAESKQKVTEHQLEYRRKGEIKWNVISPDVSDATDDVYLIKHTLTNLPPGDYETRARSRNEHGWSDYTDIIPFEKSPAKHGKNKHSKHHHNKMQDATLDTPAQHRSEEAPVEATTSGSTVLCSSLLLLLVSLLK